MEPGVLEVLLYALYYSIKRDQCCCVVPLELQGMYLEAQSWADLGDIKAGDLLDDGGLSGVVQSPRK